MITYQNSKISLKSNFADIVGKMFSIEILPETNNKGEFLEARNTLFPGLDNSH